MPDFKIYNRAKLLKKQHGTGTKIGMKIKGTE
jgi:hypothetical protein